MDLPAGPARCAAHAIPGAAETIGQWAGTDVSEDCHRARYHRIRRADASRQSLGDGASLLCLCALGVAMSLFHPTLIEAQSSGASTAARSTPSRSSTMTQLTTAPARTPEAVDGDAVRPFRAHVPDSEVADLRRRLVATRWPSKETVADQSQGAQLGNLRELVRYWGTGYDWRKAEAKLNAYPQGQTRIDGVDFHFIHVRSKNPKALP